jgi:hypothetical protein
MAARIFVETPKDHEAWLAANTPESLQPSVELAAATPSRLDHTLELAAGTSAQSTHRN